MHKNVYNNIDTLSSPNNILRPLIYLNSSRVECLQASLLLLLVSKRKLIASAIQRWDS